MIILNLYIQPGASKTEWAGTFGEGESAVPKLRLKSPAVEGKANQALLKFLAEEYDVSVSQVKLIRGEKSRFKTVQIEK